MGTLAAAAGRRDEYTTLQASNSGYIMLGPPTLTFAQKAQITDHCLEAFAAQGGHTVWPQSYLSPMSDVHRGVNCLLTGIRPKALNTNGMRGRLSASVSK